MSERDTGCGACELHAHAHARYGGGARERESESDITVPQVLRVGPTTATARRAHLVGAVSVDVRASILRRRPVVDRSAP